MLMTTNEARDAALFNNSDRAVTDDNINLSSLIRYKYSDRLDMEFGLGRQTRSPNLYERYTWSTWSMAAVMNNFVGDGNGYVGNLDLKPEVASTISAKFDWHAENNYDWSIQTMPYLTYIDDYIDALQWNPTTDQAATTKTEDNYVILKYMNQSALIYGVDVAAKKQLGANTYGDWLLKGQINYTRGTNETTGDNLYNIMPLNAKVTLAQAWNRWKNEVQLVVVDAKTNVSDERNEVETAGYALLNLKASYTVNQHRIDVGVDNLFDKFYDLPTGGAYTGEGRTMSITGIPWGIAVPGAGRSIYLGYNYKF
jgi:iron complex outermembrane receptor protein